MRYLLPIAVLLTSGGSSSQEVPASNVPGAIATEFASPSHEAEGSQGDGAVNTEPALSPQQTGPGTYGALGTEPFWGFSLTNGRIEFDVSTYPEYTIAGPAPPPIPTPTGRRYVTERLTVDIRPQVCNDGMSENLYADTVLVVIDGRILYGCGGDRVGEDMLAHSSWLIGEIDGTAVTGDEYALDFSADRMGGHAGCGYFSAPYSRSGQTLTFGPIVSDPSFCPEEGRMDHSRRTQQVLTVPLRISVESDGSLLLTGTRGSLRLMRSFGDLPTL